MTENDILDLVVEEVSLTDNPVNDDARAILAKARAKASKETDMADTPEDDMDDLDALLDELEADDEDVSKSYGDDDDLVDVALTKSMDAITRLEAERDALQDEVEHLRGRVAKAAGADDPILKSLSGAAREAYAALKAENEDLVARAEREQAIAKARTLGIGDPEEVGPLLMRIRKGTATAADADTVERLLQAGAPGDDLFQPIGKSRAGDADAEGRLATAVAEIRKAKPELTAAQATAAALRADPSLYTDSKE